MSIETNNASADAAAIRQPERWIANVFSIVFAVWLIQWAIKIIRGDWLDALDFTQPSPLSIAGIAAIINVVAIRRGFKRVRIVYSSGFFIIAFAVLTLLLHRGLRFVGIDLHSLMLFELWTLLAGPFPAGLSELWPRIVDQLLFWVFVVLTLHRLWVFIRRRAIEPPQQFTAVPYLLTQFSLTCFVLMIGLYVLPDASVITLERLIAWPPTVLWPLVFTWVEGCSMVSRAARRNDQERLAAPPRRGGNQA